MAGADIAQKQEFKVVIVGDGGTGKSTFVRKLLTDDFKPEYEPTVSCEIVPLDVETSAGPVRFFCWDTAGQEKYGTMRDGYYDNADAAIVFFDVTSRATFKNVSTWIKDIIRVCGDTIPVVVCANKVDLENRVVKRHSMKLTKELKDVTYEIIETSVLNSQNILEPLHFIIKELLGEDATLSMLPTSQEPVGPSLNSTAVLTGKRDTRRNLLKRAADTPLPNEDG